MQSFGTSLAPYLPGFFKSQLRKCWGCFIYQLDMDIFLDNIFPYLRVEDILCLRRVSKAFYLLTHEPVIWKGFLSQLTVPIPPIRPSFRYALEATDFEVEQLVTRAITLEDNWRQPNPQIVCSQTFMAQYTVLDLKLLPGGKYLIASVKDAESYRYFLFLFCLDHPCGPRALARFPIRGKAMHLQAKYMIYKGQYVIMIAFAYRGFTEGGPLNVDPNEYSSRHIIDPPHPMFSEVTCLRISLVSLDILSDPHLIPKTPEYLEIVSKQEGPFFEVAAVGGECELDIISLYEMDGVPYFSVVEQPSTIITVNLHNEQLSRIRCRHPYTGNSRHRIRAFRHLPNQKEFLVIHTITFTQDFHHHIVCLYDIPRAGGKGECTPKAIYDFLSESQVSIFHISDYGIPKKNEDNYTLQHEHHPPPPISIYAETVVPAVGIQHFVLWPDVKHTAIMTPTGLRPLKQYFYNLDHIVEQSKHLSAPFRAHVLPGAFRSLVYTVCESDRTATPALINLRRYINPEYQPSEYPIPRVPKSSRIMRCTHPPMPTNKYGTLNLDPDMRTRYQTDGIAAIAWDEGIGRVCMAYGDIDTIDVLDFSHAVHPQKTFQEWNRCQEFVYNGNM